MAKHHTNFLDEMGGFNLSVQRDASGQVHFGVDTQPRQQQIIPQVAPETQKYLIYGGIGLLLVFLMRRR